MAQNSCLELGRTFFFVQRRTTFQNDFITFDFKWNLRNIFLIWNWKKQSNGIYIDNKDLKVGNLMRIIWWVRRLERRSQGKSNKQSLEENPEGDQNAWRGGRLSSPVISIKVWNTLFEMYSWWWCWKHCLQLSYVSVALRTALGTPCFFFNLTTIFSH